MKILNATLVNIQSHPHSSIEFHPNLNVITAPSDSGKSVIIRGIKLGITNKASKNIRRKKSKSSKVILSDKLISLCRYKDDKTNQYEITTNGKKKSFSAVGRKVNDTIRGLINLSEVNIQEQKDTFFLINQSSGAVARELNKVSGLSTIDAVLKKVNKAISELKTTIRFKNMDIQELEIFISENAWVIEADKDLKVIEELNESMININHELVELSSLVESYDYYKNELKRMLPDSVYGDLNELDKINLEIENIDSEINEVDELLKSHKKYSDKLKSIHTIDLSELEFILADIESLDDTIEEIETICESISEIELQMQISERELDSINKKLSAFKICPTCKRPM